MKSKLAALTLAVLGGLASTAYAGLSTSNVAMSSSPNLVSYFSDIPFSVDGTTTALNGTNPSTYASNSNTHFWDGPWEVHATGTNTSVLSPTTVLLEVAGSYGSHAPSTYVKSWGTITNAASANFSVDSPASYKFTMSCTAVGSSAQLQHLTYTLKDDGSPLVAGVLDWNATQLITGNLAVISGQFDFLISSGTMGYTTNLTLLPGHNYSIALSDSSNPWSPSGPQLSLDSYLRLDFLNAVPEPSSTFALALPLAGVLLRRRASSRA